MKRTLFAAVAIVLGLILLVGALPCCGADQPQKIAKLRIEGMTCGGCATAVRVVLNKVDGVSDAKVSYEEKLAVVDYDPAKVTPQQLARTVERKLRYKATVIEGDK